MSAQSVYLKVTRISLRSASNLSKRRVDELNSGIGELRQLLSCVVCCQLLVDPYSPKGKRCQHNVCRLCLRGKKRLFPSCPQCEECSDFKTYEENRIMALQLLCYKTLCVHLLQTSLFAQLAGLRPQVGTRELELLPRIKLPPMSTQEFIREGSNYDDIGDTFLPQPDLPFLKGLPSSLPAETPPTTAATTPELPYEQHLPEHHHQQLSISDIELEAAATAEQGHFSPVPLLPTGSRMGLQAHSAQLIITSSTTDTTSSGFMEHAWTGQVDLSEAVSVSSFPSSNTNFAVSYLMPTGASTPFDGQELHIGQVVQIGDSSQTAVLTAIEDQDEEQESSEFAVLQGLEEQEEGLSQLDVLDVAEEPQRLAVLSVTEELGELQELEEPEELTVPPVTEEPEELPVLSAAEEPEELAVLSVTEEPEELTVPPVTEEPEEMPVLSPTEEPEELAVLSVTEEPEELNVLPVTEEPEESKEISVQAEPVEVPSRKRKLEEIQEDNEQEQEAEHEDKETKIPETAAKEEAKKEEPQEQAPSHEGPVTRKRARSPKIQAHAQKAEAEPKAEPAAKLQSAKSAFRRVRGKDNEMEKPPKPKCRCGIAKTANPLTTCRTSRCPCYKSGNTCSECNCVNCKNPHKVDFIDSDEDEDEEAMKTDEQEVVPPRPEEETPESAAPEAPETPSNDGISLVPLSNLQQSQHPLVLVQNENGEYQGFNIFRGNKPVDPETLGLIRVQLQNNEGNSSIPQYAYIMPPVGVPAVPPVPAPAPSPPPPPPPPPAPEREVIEPPPKKFRTGCRTRRGMANFSALDTVDELVSGGSTSNSAAGDRLSATDNAHSLFEEIMSGSDDL